MFGFFVTLNYELWFKYYSWIFNISSIFYWSKQIPGI